MADIFTFTEKTVRRHDVNFLNKQVRAVLKELKINAMCANNMPRDHGQLYTTKQASEIINDVVDDTIYHEGKWL